MNEMKYISFMRTISKPKNKKTRVYIPVEISGNELAEIEKTIDFPIDGEKICAALKFFSKNLTEEAAVSSTQKENSEIPNLQSKK